jgi:hypothetical protein
VLAAAGASALRRLRPGIVTASGDGIDGGAATGDDADLRAAFELRERNSMAATPPR